MEKENKKIYIVLGLLLVIGLIPLIKAKPKLGGKLTSTKFEKIR